MLSPSEKLLETNRRNHDDILLDSDANNEESNGHLDSGNGKENLNLSFVNIFIHLMKDSLRVE